MSAKSQTLDEYPALESYAINRIFLHARLAQDSGANPAPIILLLHDGCYWKRWLILQDNVTRSSSLLSLAVEQKLDTWVQYMVGCKSVELSEEEMSDALALAIRRRRAKAVSILAAHGAHANLNQRLREGLENRETLQAFLATLEQRQDQNMTNEQALKAVLPEYRDLLSNAIQRGDMAYASDLFNFGVRFPLHSLPSRSFYAPSFIPSTLNFLVDNGVDINEQDERGRTLVHIASESRDIDLLRGLVAFSADINAKDHEGRTPMDIVFGRTEFLFWGRKYIEELASAGARLNITYRDTNGWTPLHKAITADTQTLVTMCLTYGADINERDKQGRTALHIAFALCPSDTLSSNFWEPLAPPIRGGNRRITLCDYLLERGSDPSAKTVTGLTPLHVAADAGIYGLMEKMVALGAKLDERDNLGRTPIYFAAAQGYEVVVGVLLGLGANARIRDNFGISPLQRASEGKYSASSATARLICAHLQGSNERSCSCISETSHTGEHEEME
ncbi:ankyrin repeat-containing domain protein [Nemania abortiva]|nr:ankyrin repeat-containing domain protein [Nemania abortiva]